jgi:hypothetical protein
VYSKTRQVYGAVYNQPEVYLTWELKRPSFLTVPASIPLICYDYFLDFLFTAEHAENAENIFKYSMISAVVIFQESLSKVKKYLFTAKHAESAEITINYSVLSAVKVFLEGPNMRTKYYVYRKAR